MQTCHSIRKSSNIFLLKLTLLISFSLASCISNKVALESDKEFLTSQVKFTKAINVEIQDLLKSNIIGYQYLFFILPFGQNKFVQNHESIIGKISEVLAESGYHATSDSNQYKLNIQLVDMKANVYDYLVIRRLTCTANLEVQILKKQNESFNLLSQSSLTGKYSQLEEFAFKNKIQHCLNQAFASSLTENLKKLDLKYLETVYQ